MKKLLVILLLVLVLLWYIIYDKEKDLILNSAIETKEINNNIEIKKIDNTEENIEKNPWDKAFWKELQEYIKELMKNPDKIINDNCLDYELEVKSYCETKKKEYLELINNK